MIDPGSGSIVVLAPGDTHDLRRRVLRDGNPDAQLVWAGDDEPTTAHLGIILDGAIVAVSTWLAPTIDTTINTVTDTTSDTTSDTTTDTTSDTTTDTRSDATSISPTSDARPLTQLRGMATEPSLAGIGLGRRLLSAGLDRAAAHGTELVWANARLGALRFYERSGFTVMGDVFTIAETGLPHRRVEYPISPSAT
ncbi:GNAT family N-acetyltransferase [Ilumatobacter sp.]|uniref:GNAT family N-acetyltransferase n=1 Tax=Ilumatobacter sp. TaxID=1967498 RepID=UPI003C6ACE23